MFFLESNTCHSREDVHLLEHSDHTDAHVLECNDYIDEQVIECNDYKMVMS